MDVDHLSHGYTVSSLRRVGTGAQACLSYFLKAPLADCEGLGFRAKLLRFFILPRTESVFVLDIGSTIGSRSVHGDADNLHLGDSISFVRVIGAWPHAILNTLMSSTLHCDVLHALTELLILFVLSGAKLGRRLDLFFGKSIRSLVNLDVDSFGPGEGIGAFRRVSSGPQRLNNFLSSSLTNLERRDILTELTAFLVLTWAKIQLTLLNNSQVSGSVATHVSSAISPCPGYLISSLKVVGAGAHAAFSNDFSSLLTNTERCGVLAELLGLLILPRPNRQVFISGKVCFTSRFVNCHISGLDSRNSVSSISIIFAWAQRLFDLLVVPPTDLEGLNLLLLNFIMAWSHLL